MAIRYSTTFWGWRTKPRWDRGFSPLSQCSIDCGAHTTSAGEDHGNREDGKRADHWEVGACNCRHPVSRQSTRAAWLRSWRWCFLLLCMLSHRGKESRGTIKANFPMDRCGQTSEVIGDAGASEHVLVMCIHFDGRDNEPLGNGKQLKYCSTRCCPLRKAH